jgi:Cu/Ag efflux protein CusF
MKALSTGFVAALLLLSPLAGFAGAQTKTLTGEVKTATATVEAIDASTRTVTLKGPEGNFVNVVAPASVTKFSEIKVGDTVTARYYDNIVLRLKPAGEKSVDSGDAAVTKAGGVKPGATAATQRTITATITEIDPAVPSITFTGPNNWKYSSKVEDKKALAKVKVGDKVDITWTEALLVSFDTIKK